MVGTSRRDRRGTVGGIDENRIFDLEIRLVLLGLGSDGLHCIIEESVATSVSGNNGL
jgi:hypothetical protein